MNLVERIDAAFAHRARPDQPVPEGAPETDEYMDARALADYDRRDLTAERWRGHASAIFGLSASAFCYYLPSVLRLSVKENRTDISAIDSIIGMLDRSNTPSSWDRFFADRWTRLTPAEYEALQEWLVWLSGHPSMEFASDALGRASDSLSVLSNAASATPLAGR